MFRIILQVLLCGVLAMPAAAQHITGYVRDTDDQPLRNVQVNLVETEFMQYTDRNGQFRVDTSGHPRSPIQLTFTRHGYQEHTATIPEPWSSADTLNVTLQPVRHRSETLVVTATRTRSDLEDVSIPVQVIEQAEIRQSGNMRLSDVLGEQAGLQLVNNHGTGVQMQGFDPEYTLILIDGNPVIGRTAGTLDLTRISVRNVRQIEIVKGPSSALWGSDALAGVINIITDTAGDETLSAGLTTRYGTHNTSDLSGDITYNTRQIGNKISVNHHRSDGYRRNSGAVSKTIPDFANYTLNYRGSLDVSDNLTVSARARWFDEQLSNNTLIQQPENRSVLLVTRDQQQDLTLGTEIVYRTAAGLELMADWMYAYFVMETTSRAEETGTLFSTDRFRQFHQRGEIRAAYNSGTAHQFLGGFGLIDERLNAQRYPSQPDFQTQFAFFQHTWSPSGDLNLTSGLRYDSHSEYRNQVSPKVSFRYRPASWIQIRSSLGRGFKAPEFRQLFLDFTNSTSGYSVFVSATVADGIRRLAAEGTLAEILIPADNLDNIRAESSWAVNSGFDVDMTPSVRLRVNMFHNAVQDLIEVAPVARRTNGQSVFTYFNVDQVRIQGLESAIQFTYRESLGGSLGYQLLDARSRISETQTLQDAQGELVQRSSVRYEPLFNRSRHALSLRVFANHRNWGGSLRGIYRGPYAMIDRNGNGYADDNEF